MKQKHREDRAVAFRFEGFALGCIQQAPGLRIADRGRLAFVVVGGGALDAFDRIVRNGILFAEILEL